MLLQVVYQPARDPDDIHESSVWAKSYSDLAVSRSSQLGKSAFGILLTA